MIIIKWYFWAFFTALATFGLLKLLPREAKPHSVLFPSKTAETLVAVAAMLIAWGVNKNHQLFCQPVPWVLGLLILSACGLAVFPWLPTHGRFHSIKLILGGWLATLATYLLLFAGPEYLIFLGFASALFVPLSVTSWFLNKKFHNLDFSFLNLPFITLNLPLYMLWKVGEDLFQNSGKRNRFLLLFAPVVVILLATFTTLRMDKVVRDYRINQVAKENLNPMDSYFLELELGAHWKYHTRICYYDGTRPPLHDPVLVIQRAAGGEELDLQLEARRTTHEQTFPNHQPAPDCRCATESFPAIGF